MTVDELDRAISREAREYPAFLLAGCTTGLCLFSAAFLGVNDVVHFARRGIETVAVDTNAERLEQMRRRYPACVEFVAGDAFEYSARAWSDRRSFDAISVDPFLGGAAERVLRELQMFLELARHVATITIPKDHVLPELDGWNVSAFPRTETASWMVLTRV